jgi:hypothetical protein
MFSPELIRAMAESDEKILRLYCQAYRYQAFAGNLCLSVQNEVTKPTLWRAMDRLEEGAGDVINEHATEAGIHLIPYELEDERNESIRNERILIPVRQLNWREIFAWSHRKLRGN